MKMGEYNCENNLEVFGDWDLLKNFYNDNWCKTILNIKDELEMIEWERGLFIERLDSIYYIFLTKENPPLEWLRSVSCKYKELDFTLGYQNLKSGMYGEVVYRGGEIYYNGEEVL